MKGFRNKKKFYIPALLSVAVLGLALTVGGLFAKYQKSVSFSSRITFSADLAKEVCLAEHGVRRKADGTYSFTTDEEVTQVGYTAMPGVDLPKDPFIRIDGKSAVDAYLYVEVFDTCPEEVTYTLTSHWLKLDGLLGEHGGQVYVYSEDGSTPSVLDETFASSPISILQDDTVFVSECLTAADSFVLNFYGYMAQTEPDGTSKSVFEHCFKSGAGKE